MRARLTDLSGSSTTEALSLPVLMGLLLLVVDGWPHGVWGNNTVPDPFEGWVESEVDVLISMELLGC